MAAFSPSAPSLAPTEHARKTEERLKSDATAWAAPTDAAAIPWATDAEIPVIDLGEYLAARAAGADDAACDADTNEVVGTLRAKLEGLTGARRVRARDSLSGWAAEWAAGRMPPSRMGGEALYDRECAVQ